MQNLPQQITAIDTFSCLILFFRLTNLHTAMLDDFRITFKVDLHDSHFINTYYTYFIIPPYLQTVIFWDSNDM